MRGRLGLTSQQETPGNREFPDGNWRRELKGKEGKRGNPDAPYLPFCIEQRTTSSDRRGRCQNKAGLVLGEPRHAGSHPKSQARTPCPRHRKGEGHGLTGAFLLALLSAATDTERAMSLAGEALPGRRDTGAGSPVRIRSATSELWTEQQLRVLFMLEQKEGALEAQRRERGRHGASSLGTRRSGSCKHRHTVLELLPNRTKHLPPNCHTANNPKHSPGEASGELLTAFTQHPGCPIYGPGFQQRTKGREKPCSPSRAPSLHTAHGCQRITRAHNGPI